MKVLSINAGSSSLKFSVFEMPEEKMLINGYIQRIGMDEGLYYIKIDGERNYFNKDLKDHDEAVEVIVEELKNFNIIKDINEIHLVGHRVVHGGEEYSESVVINDKVLKTIEELSPLAPLHNPANITGIKAFMHMLPDVINVAVFDTAFHQTMKKETYMYAVPYEWYEKHGVRKYGFHGTSHRYIYDRVCERMNKKDLKVISCHLGNGVSLCAIDKGISIDTTMGLTPLAGLMMGTRCGDIDPAIIEFMMKKANKTIEEVMNDLNKNSGLIGISGVSSDNRDLEENRDNNRVVLAHNMYAKKAADYIASYNNTLGGADVICFAGGIGENALLVRKRILERLSSLGIVIDEEANASRHGTNQGEVCITKSESKIQAHVIETDEEVVIARDTFSFME